MTNKDREDGGPAYPSTEFSEGSHNTGMSLRDYFAGQALMGMISGNALEEYTEEAGITTMEELSEAFANRSYIIADAMIKERNK